MTLGIIIDDLGHNRFIVPNPWKFLLNYNLWEFQQFHHPTIPYNMLVSECCEHKKRG